MLVARTALPAFFHEIVELRDALGRLDKRIARIENRRRQDEQQQKNA